MNLFIGALPPPIGGTTISFSYLEKHLKNENNIFFDVNSLRNYDIKKFACFFHHLFECKSWNFHLSDNATKYLLPFFLLFGKLLNKKVTLRQFGGELYYTYTNSNFFYKKIIVLTLSKLDVLYLQTDFLYYKFKEILHSVEIKKLPTSRISKSLLNKNLSLKIDTLKLVYLGRVSKNKGILTVCELIKDIPNVEFHIYGELSDDIKDKDFKFFNNVFYHGFVDNENVQHVLINYHIFIMLSSHPGEGLSGSVIEAMMSGLPLILSNWNSLPEFIFNNGYLINDKKYDDLKHILNNYFNYSLWEEHSLMSSNLSKKYDFNSIVKIISEDLL